VNFIVFFHSYGGVHPAIAAHGGVNPALQLFFVKAINEIADTTSPREREFGGCDLYLSEGSQNAH
ncbi:MAG: hypothetical protein WA822_17715, partial [Albidovulum sp.]